MQFSNGIVVSYYYICIMCVLVLNVYIIYASCGTIHNSVYTETNALSEQYF